MIYFIRTEEKLKVGYTDNLDKRLSQYRTHNPNVELIFTMDGDRTLESQIHDELKAHRVDREWFMYNDEVKSYISSKQVIPMEHFLMTANILDIMKAVKTVGAFKLVYKLGQLSTFNSGKVTLNKHLREQIAAELNVSITNVSKYLKTLKDYSIIVGSNNVYHLNPRILWKGTGKVRKQCIKVFDTL